MSIARKSYPTDTVGEGEEGQNEGIEMEGPLVNVVVGDETCEEDGVQNLMQEETDDYFEDPTSILCKYWILVAQYIYTGKRNTPHSLRFPSGRH